MNTLFVEIFENNIASKLLCKKYGFKPFEHKNNIVLMEKILKK